MPLLRVLFGSDAQWAIEPDSRAAAVHARRVEITRSLAQLVWWLPSNHGLSPEPPGTLDELAGQVELLRQLDFRWRPPTPAEYGQELKAAADRFNALSQRLRLVTVVINAARLRWFGGEDPLIPTTRATWRAAWNAVPKFEREWHIAARDAGVNYPVFIPGQSHSPAPGPAGLSEATTQFRKWLLRMIRSKWSAVAPPWE